MTRVITVIALVDTNSCLNGIDMVIPGNDDASRSIRLITKIISDSCATGLESSKCYDPISDKESPVIQTIKKEETVVKKVVAEEPVVEETKAEEVVTEEAVVEETKAEEVVTEEPVVEETKAEEDETEEADDEDSASEDRETKEEK